MIVKRVDIFLGIFSILILLLILRLFGLQVATGGKLAAKASEQRFLDTRVEKIRGMIYDRNMIPLVNRVVKTAAVIKPADIKKDDKLYEKLSGLLSIDRLEFNKSITSQKKPLVYELTEGQANELINAGFNSVAIIRLLGRYDENSVARHILGYLSRSDKTGLLGLEKFYEDFLEKSGSSYVGVVTDAVHNPIAGLGYRVVKTGSDNVEQGVKLTVDYHIQKIVENVMNEQKLKGAVVVEAVDTGDIVAITSKPDFDPNRVENYLHSENKELYNRATAAYDLGSVFKIIIAASAFEDKGISIGRPFFCKGYIDAGDIRVDCTQKEGHGLITLLDAFADSCNSAFVELGLICGPANIIDMAKKFGLGRKTGIGEQGIDEAAGNLPHAKYFSQGAVAHMSIGQGDILVTPVQVADVVATVASGGIKNNVNIVDSIIDGDGNVIKKIRNPGAKRIISRETCDLLKIMMHQVTENGTGKKANLDLYGGSAGKTGSAQTGWFEGEEKMVHAWFAGYFPINEPRYSIAVFIENGRSGGTVAAPIFKEIAQKIIEAGL